MNRHERIMERKGPMGNRHDRKLEKYSDGFNENFKFFFLLSRRGLITFCGERIVVEVTKDQKLTARHCFKLFEDGRYKNGKTIECCQPNILRHVLMGKKGWGLWTAEWSAGIAECSFTEQEIMNGFIDRGIDVPKCFMDEFDNRIWKFKKIRHEKTLVELGLSGQ